MKQWVSIVVVFFAAAMMTAPVPSPATGTMKMTGASFPLPTNSEPVRLSTLSYGGIGGFVEVTSVQLQLVSKGGEDPVRAVWAFTASNGKPQLRRVRVSVYLLDTAKKRIACAKKTKLLKSNKADQEFVVKMKVKKATWDRAERVFVRVDFLST